MNDLCRRRPPEEVAAEFAVVKRFADALAAGDFKLAAMSLAHNGDFMVNGKRGEDRWVGKRAFLIWLTRQWNTYVTENNLKRPMHWKFDRCFDCSIGRPVLLLEDGLFPVKNKQPWQTMKTGLAFEIVDGQIVSSLLCSHFMLHENPFIKPDPLDPEAMLEEPGALN